MKLLISNKDFTTAKRIIEQTTAEDFIQVFLSMANNGETSVRFKDFFPRVLQILFFKAKFSPEALSISSGAAYCEIKIANEVFSPLGDSKGCRGVRSQLSTLVRQLFCRITKEYDKFVQHIKAENRSVLNVNYVESIAKSKNISALNNLPEHGDINTIFATDRALSLSEYMQKYRLSEQDVSSRNHLKEKVNDFEKPSSVKRTIGEVEAAEVLDTRFNQNKKTKSNPSPFQTRLSFFGANSLAESTVSIANDEGVSRTFGNMTLKVASVILPPPDVKMYSVTF
ncbi:hypothetical protein B1207_06825 [Legionella quinlivanii]|uniref:Uncharacterized protein n=1 Tax=Legionella quinlivanii TaxID=45073 RepID=A0A364LKK2_9GAMM|nr:hypothetical protein [Legionella quinlivanii]RAP37128.1 hypothetical protein B1207_06825 [Legionella quinlivanii]